MTYEDIKFVLFVCQNKNFGGITSNVGKMPLRFKNLGAMHSIFFANQRWTLRRTYWLDNPHSKFLWFLLDFTFAERNFQIYGLDRQICNNTFGLDSQTGKIEPPVRIFLNWAIQSINASNLDYPAHDFVKLDFPAHRLFKTGISSPQNWAIQPTNFKAEHCSP